MARTTTKPQRTGVYGGASADERRADRRRRLMDAALEIMGTDGWSQTSMRGVCERAQVGPRFIYESFANLDALAVAVLDEVVEGALAKVVDALAEAPADDLSAQVHRAVGAFIRDITDDPRRARLLFAEAHGSPALVHRRHEAIRSIAAALAAQSVRVPGLPADDDPFVRAAGVLLAGGMAEVILTWMQGDLALTRDQVIDLVAEIILTVGERGPAIATKVGGGRG